MWIDEKSEVSEVATTSEANVRKDLSEWQERHATLVLGSVKQISKLRYELCPRVMKERRFWRIYFTLVSTHEAGTEPPDKPKKTIQHSNMDYVYKIANILGNEEFTVIGSHIGSIVKLARRTRLYKQL
ncbi:unnamed protein product [Eruca vesicaria subsp. sativa]|uniref:BSD domain-containing protein n=1 Tax=Eruca vesicaria subsp. sativa TaxID=29727 RepID=A0ABC8JZL8_ERUVS|nr:unnamed protein product [Eruca vesicaria subsp. sativa]